MKILVQKYGGTSVADPEHIKQAAKRIAKAVKSGNKVIVVVSALGKTTDDLVGLCLKITLQPRRREMDVLLSAGEQISSSLLALALGELGVKAISLSGRQAGIRTDASHTRARILAISKTRVLKEFKEHAVVVVAGFQGFNHKDDVTTMGRGGSDLSAVALAHRFQATACEIYTDVDGIYSTDPRLCSAAKKMKRISYEEMLELASSGAQVMQARSIELAWKYKVPLHVRSSKSDATGTWVVEGDKSMEKTQVRGVSLNKKEAKITLVSVSDKPGIAGNIFRNIAKAGVNVDMIIQNVSLGGKSTDISFTVPRDNLDDALEAIRRVKPAIPKENIIEDKNVAKISIVGIGMRSHTGVAADMFEVLGKHKINIDMISTSEIKISCVLKKSLADKAVEVLHKHFIKNETRYSVV